MEPTKKKGIMGGTFNPIHYGHLLLAEQAREYACLDEIIFMPSGNSYMKDSSEIVPGKHRLAMAELALSDNPFFNVSAIEIERDGPTYTYETLHTLRQRQPDTLFYFILGADNLFSIEHWKAPEEIFGSCRLIAAEREDKGKKDWKRQAEYLEQRYGTQVILLPERRIDISSSEIRRRLQRGDSVKYMVPEKVLQYIYENRLYKQTGGQDSEIS